MISPTRDVDNVQSNREVEAPVGIGTAPDRVRDKGNRPTVIEREFPAGSSWSTCTQGMSPDRVNFPPTVELPLL